MRGVRHPADVPVHQRVHIGLNLPDEIEATAFAMELLMPAEWLRAEVEELPILTAMSTALVEDLAKRYAVEPAIMMARLIQLKLLKI